MEKNLVPFLDLMLGFVAIVFILIAITPANVGDFDVEERDHYMLLQVTLEGEKQRPSSPSFCVQPSSPITKVREEDKCFLARIGRKRFLLTLYVRCDHERLIEEEPTFRYLWQRKALTKNGWKFSPKNFRVFGELAPSGKIVDGRLSAQKLPKAPKEQLTMINEALGNGRTKLSIQLLEAP